VSVGIVEGGRKKKITEKGRTLALALDHEMPTEITEKWHQLIVGNDFFNKLISAVRIRRGMDIQTLQAHIAYSAGQSKSATAMAGAGAVVDILKAAGLLKEEDGKLVATDDGVHEPATLSVRAGDTVTVQSQERVHLSPAVPVAAPSGVPVTIQIQIQCSPADIADLGDKLRTLIEEITRPQTKSSTE
jgi:plastocyanin